MTLAYGTYGAELCHNDSLKDDILYGLEWMYQNRYGRAEMEGHGWHNTSGYNWFDWKIASPTQLISTLMIMENELTDAQIADYLVLFDRLVPMPSDTGANRLNMAKLVIGSALLQNNPKKVQKTQIAVEDAFNYVDNGRNNGQGFYTDGSYIYHTLHPMNGTYGLDQFKLTGPFVAMFSGTPFEITAPAAQNVTEWIYNAFDPLMYQGAMFRMVKGRYPSGMHSTGAEALGGMLDSLDALNAADREKVTGIIKAQVRDDTSVNFYSTLSLSQSIKLAKVMDDSAASRESLLTNHVYHNEDKVVHQRGNFALGLSMSSSRIYNYECINNANKTGWYVGDGMTEYLTKDNLKQSSDMYWSQINPYRLPGTTVDSQPRKAVSIAQKNEYLSSKDFVGGVSLGDTYGTAAMWLESYHNDEDHGDDRGSYGGPAPAHDCNLQAKKAWFMFDDEVVCLGSDVNAHNDAEVLTVVDNKIAEETKTVGDEEETDAYPVLSAVASETPEEENVAENTIDGDYTTKWAAETGATITWDLGEEKDLGFIMISFLNGSSRYQNFILETSEDNENWTETYNGKNSGETEGPEPFTLNNTKGQYVRFTNLGNSNNGWVSILEAAIYAPNEDGSIGVKPVDIVGTNTFIADDTQIELTNEDTSLTGTKWAHFEKAGGYYFPEGGELSARYTNQPASFMELWFSHGINPENGTYAYTLLPAKTAEETKAYAEDPDIEILSNTADLQVVRDRKLNATGMVFWKEGTYGDITVDQPMIIMMQEENGRVTLSACDPTHKLEEASITLHRAFLPAEQDPMMTITGEDTVKISMDLKNSNGRTLEATLMDKESEEELSMEELIESYIKDGQLNSDLGDQLLYRVSIIHTMVDQEQFMEAIYYLKDLCSYISAPAVWQQGLITEDALNAINAKVRSWEEKLKAE